MVWISQLKLRLKFAALIVPAIAALMFSTYEVFNIKQQKAEQLERDADIVERSKGYTHWAIQRQTLGDQAKQGPQQQGEEKDNLRQQSEQDNKEASTQSEIHRMLLSGIEDLLQQAKLKAHSEERGGYHQRRQGEWDFLKSDLDALSSKALMAKVRTILQNMQQDLHLPEHRNALHRLYQLFSLHQAHVDLIRHFGPILEENTHYFLNIINSQAIMESWQNTFDALHSPNDINSLSSKLKKAHLHQFRQDLEVLQQQVKKHHFVQSLQARLGLGQGVDLLSLGFLKGDASAVKHFQNNMDHVIQEIGHLLQLPHLSSQDQKDLNLLRQSLFQAKKDSSTWSLQLSPQEKVDRLGRLTTMASQGAWQRLQAGGSTDISHAQWKTSALSLEKDLEKLLFEQYDQLEHTVQGNIKQLNKEQWEVTAGASAFIAFLILATIVINRDLKSKLRITRALSEAMLKGDFRAQIKAPKGQDELGRLVQAMLEVNLKVSRILEDIKNNTMALHASSLEINHISKDISDNSQANDELTKSTQHNITELNNRLEQSAQCLQESQGSIAHIHSDISLSKQSQGELHAQLNQLEQSLKSINETSHKGEQDSKGAKEVSNHALQTMTRLSELTTGMQDAINAMKRIAEQTNLLALNATIEASAAGKAGSGFAVVASNIKELATQSSNFAEEITDLITSVKDIGERGVGDIESVDRAVSQLYDCIHQISNKVLDGSESHQQLLQQLHQFDQQSQSIIQNLEVVEKHAHQIQEHNQLDLQTAKDSQHELQQLYQSNHQSYKLSSHSQESTNDMNTLVQEIIDVALELQTHVPQKQDTPLKKKAFPVVREVPFVEGDGLIISRTDLKGVIEFTNHMFQKLSGFSDEELVGRPHNLIRHPDMPKAAFKDLWDTIKAGKIWKGCVKNLSKDGAYYWVHAKVMPIHDPKTNELQSYLSVRRPMTEDEKKEHDKLYLSMCDQESPKKTEASKLT